MDKTTFDTVAKKIAGYEEEAIYLEKELTSRQALGPENDGQGEKEKAEFLRTYLNDKLQCDQIDDYPAPDDRVPAGERPNLIGWIKGKSDARTIWIMSHMDVVPPGDMSKWDGDPWTIRVEDGKIYGRGTEDNQQGIVSSLLAAKAFREADVTPEYDIALLLVSDEETGSQYGVQHMLKQHRALFRDEDFIIIPDAGNAEGTLVEVAEKSIVWFKFNVQGKQTHGSTPELGVNAFKAGSNLIVRLDELYRIFDKSDDLFEPPISTFEPTKKEANVPNVNTIPGEDVFYFDCRILPDYDVEQVRSEVERICKEVEKQHEVTIEITTPQVVVSPPATPADAPVVRALLSAISELRDIEPAPKGIGGGTVAAFFRERNLPAVVWATQDETLHGPNEYVKIDNILNDAKVFAHVALQQ